MIARALILKEDNILMVKQYVQRGDIVWTFPGGGIEAGETPEEACIREVKEETGYVIAITDLLYQKEDNYTFIAEITGGELYLDGSLKENADLVDIAWVSVDDSEKFDHITRPLLKRILKKFRI